MSEGIQIVSRTDLKKMIEGDADFTLVEVLSEDSYRKGHLPGAINIPGDSIRARAPEAVPDRDTVVVVYCANPSCTASDRAARLFHEMGYTNVYHYRGGKEHWKEGGLSLTSETLAGASA